MNTEELLDYDDLGDALREGRALRPARGYRFLLAQGDLNFQSRQVTDPVPLGRQILEAAGLDPRDGYSLFAILPSGDFEDVRLDEPFDLRGRGAERFVAFLTDRDFKLTLNDDELRWGKPADQRRGPLRPRQAWATARPSSSKCPAATTGSSSRRLIDLTDARHRALHHGDRANATTRSSSNSRPRDGRRPARHVRAGRAARVPGPARAERRVLHDLPPRRLDAARGRARCRRRRRSQKERHDLQCHANCSIVIPTSSGCGTKVTSFSQQGGSSSCARCRTSTAHREVRTGTLISSLTMAGDMTRPPDTHVVHLGRRLSRATPTARRSPGDRATHGGNFDLGHGVTAQARVLEQAADGGHATTITR